MLARARAAAAAAPAAGAARLRDRRHRRSPSTAGLAVAHRARLRPGAGAPGHARAPPCRQPARRTLPDRARRIPLRGVAGRRPGGAVGRAARPGRPVRAQPAACRAAADVGFDDSTASSSPPSIRRCSTTRPSAARSSTTSSSLGSRAMPGVEAASVAKVVPLALDFDGGRRRMRPSGYAPQPARTWRSTSTWSAPGYLRDARHPARCAAATSPTPIAPGSRAGDHRQRGLRRALLARARSAGAARSASAATRGRWLRVVGVVANTKYIEPRRDGAADDDPAVRAALLAPQAKLHVRTAGDPAALGAGGARRDPRPSIRRCRSSRSSTLAERTSASLLPQQIAAR